MEIMTKEESYADRRQLFKNIWETAMQIDDKDVDNIMTKPKVIKTLRLDEVDRGAIIKRKKERIKNLRTVCKKILDFCDRQDADDMLNEQKSDGKLLVEGEKSPQRQLDAKIKKIKTYRRKKKVKRAKSLYEPKMYSGYQATTSKRTDDYPRIFPNTTRNNSLIKKRTSFKLVQRISVTHRRGPKVVSNPDAEGSNVPAKGSATRRKVPRKKRSKQKMATTVNLTPPGPSGIDWPEP